MQFSEYVKIREEKFGTVIFDTLREKVFVANESGKEILDFLQRGCSTEEIIANLEKAYGPASSEIKNDVNGFIAYLKDNSIVTS